MQENIRQYVEGCNICPCTKPKRVSPAAPLVPNKIPTKPWEIISIDMISPFPESNGHKVILVIVDQFSKKIEAIHTMTELTSKGVTMCNTHRDCEPGWWVIRYIWTYATFPPHVFHFIYICSHIKHALYACLII